MAAGWSPLGVRSDTILKAMPPSLFSGRGGRCGVNTRFSPATSGCVASIGCWLSTWRARSERSAGLASSALRDAVMSAKLRVGGPVLRSAGRVDGAGRQERRLRRLGEAGRGRALGLRRAARTFGGRRRRLAGLAARGARVRRRVGDARLGRVGDARLGRVGSWFWRAGHGGDIWRPSRAPATDSLGRAVGSAATGVRTRPSSAAEPQLRILPEQAAVMRIALGPVECSGCDACGSLTSSPAAQQDHGGATTARRNMAGAGIRIRGEQRRLFDVQSEPRARFAAR